MGIIGLLVSIGKGGCGRSIQLGQAGISDGSVTLDGVLGSLDGGSFFICEGWRALCKNSSFDLGI
jgi:hypothetical protein